MKTSFFTWRNRRNELATVLISAETITVAHEPHVLSLVLDISQRKSAEAELKRLHEQLLEASRAAGMAEVATGVLHNVGNVLNSVNVSAGLVVEKISRSKVPQITKAAALMTGRNGGLADYLTNDPKGKMLPDFFAKLGAFLEAENAEILREVHQLAARLIEQILTDAQRSAARVNRPASLTTGFSEL